MDDMTCTWLASEQSVAEVQDKLQAAVKKAMVCGESNDTRFESEKTEVILFRGCKYWGG